MNISIVTGTVSSVPEVRTLPSGDLVTTLSITADGSLKVSVPLSFTNEASAAAFAVGDRVIVRGYVQRRFFRTAGATQSRTELVVSASALVGKRRDVRKLVAQVERDLGELAQMS